MIAMWSNPRKIQIHPARVSFAGYQTSLEQDNDKINVWRVIVHPLENVLCEGIDRTITAEETRQEFQAAHSLAGKIICSFIRNNLNGALETKLRHLTGEKVHIETLSGEIHVDYIANGWSYVVYCVTFQEKPLRETPLRFVSKISKSINKSITKEIFLQKRGLEKIPGFIPRVGDIFETERGLVYFEEEIDGRTLDRCLINGELPHPLLQLTIRTLFTVYRTLGVVPLDPHVKNLMVRNFGKSGESITMIDFCLEHWTSPHEILETLNFHYGMPGWVWDKHFSYFRILLKLLSLLGKRKAPSEKNRLIFEAILEGLGETAGRNFLEEALRKIKQKDPNILSLLCRYPFDGWWIEDGHLDANWIHEEGRGVSFLKGKLKRNIAFIEMIRGLESYLRLLRK